jgi:N-glycosylase/DNA lyase
MTTPPGFHALPLPLAQLSLAAVLKCGQSFRWSIYPLHAALPSDPTHEYRLCLQDRVVCLRQSSGALFYCAVFPDVSVSLETVSTRDAETLEWLRDYFQLDVDLVKLYGEWAERDPVFAKLRTRFEGNTNAPTGSMGEPRFVRPYNCPSSRSSPHSDSYALRTTTSPVSQKW